VKDADITLIYCPAVRGEPQDSNAIEFSFDADFELLGEKFQAALWGQPMEVPRKKQKVSANMFVISTYALFSNSN